MRFLKLSIAMVVVAAPIWLVWKVVGREGLVVLFSVFAGAAGIAGLYFLAHWAIKTVLMALGFQEETLEKERTKPFCIFFWRQ